MADLEKRFQDYGAELERDVRPVGLVDVADRLDGRPVQLDAGRRKRPWWIAVAAAVVLLIAFTPLLARRLTSENPAGEETPVETTAAETGTTMVTETTVGTLLEEEASLLPRPIPVGEPFESSFGTWVWARVDGDADTLPEFGIQAAEGGGFIAHEGGRTWNSVDGIEWSATGEIGDNEVGFTRTYTVGVTEWSRQWTPEGVVYHRSIGGDWVVVDIPDLATPPVAGLTWNDGWSGDPVGLGDTVVVSTSAWAQIAFSGYYGTFPVPEGEDWGGQENIEPWPEWDEVSETIRLREPFGTNKIIGVLEVRIVEGVPDVIEFVDTETGDVVVTVESTVPGLATEALRDRLVWGGLEYAALMVSSDGGDTFTQAEAPWSGTSRSMTAMGGAFTTFVMLEEPGVGWLGVESWTSTDGRSWVQTDPPPFLEIADAAMVDWVDVQAVGDVVVATVVTSNTMGQTSNSWVSQDGTTWTRIEELSDDRVGRDINSFVETSFGYAIATMRWDGPGLVEIWVSEDGMVWEHIPGADGIHEPFGAGGIGVSFAGDTAFAMVTEDGGPRTLWVGRFVD